MKRQNKKSSLIQADMFYNSVCKLKPNDENTIHMFFTLFGFAKFGLNLILSCPLSSFSLVLFHVASWRVKSIFAKTCGRVCQFNKG